MVPKKFAHNPRSVEGDEPADILLIKWGHKVRLTSGQGWGQSVGVTTITVHQLGWTTITVYIKCTANCKKEEKSRDIPGHEDEGRDDWLFCFSVFWTCYNVISILCTLLHKRMNPIPVKRPIVGLFYEWVVNLALSVFEWGLVSTVSNEVTWMCFTVIEWMNKIEFV